VDVILLTTVLDYEN
jgi:hypothetical protein